MDEKYVKNARLFNVDCFRIGAPYFIKNTSYTYYGILTEAKPTCLTFVGTRAYQSSDLKNYKKATPINISIAYGEIDDYEVELLESTQDCYAIKKQEELS